MADLKAAARDALPKNDFGIPSKREYPMPDKGHAANAKARATQQVKKGAMSASEAAAIRAKADKILETGGLKKKKPSTPVATGKGDPPLPVDDAGEAGAAGDVPEFDPVQI